MVLPYCSATIAWRDSAVCQEHEDWQCLGPNGLRYEPSGFGNMCYHSPWGDYIREKLLYLLDVVGFDGLALDGPVHGLVCLEQNHKHPSEKSVDFMNWVWEKQFYREVAVRGKILTAPETWNALFLGISERPGGYQEEDQNELDGLPFVTMTRSCVYEARYRTPPSRMYTIYPITLYNGQNIHAELVGPKNENLNYALALYEMNTSTGSLTALIDSCTYATNSSIPQTIATINKAASAKSYALIVLARTGFSTTDSFSVNITLGIGGDPGESNDNAYTAYTLGTLSKDGIAVSGTTLDSPYDVDWFAFAAPDLTDFSGIKISNSNSASKVKFQLYYASGSTMVEAVPVNGIYPLSKGTNYLRVTDNGNNFATGDFSYSIGISPVYAASHAAYEVQMDKYNYLPDQTYGMFEGEEYIGEKRYAVIGGSNLTWKATYLSASGYLCLDATDRLVIEMTNTAWNPDNMRYTSARGNAVNGVARVTLTCLQSFGQINHGVGDYSQIWADYDCTLTMYSQQFGSFFEGKATQPIFITSKIFS